MMMAPGAAPPPASWIDVGLAHHQAGNLAEAAAALQAGLRARPDDGQLWKLAGILALQSERPAVAAEMLETARRHLPEDADLLCHLSMALREEGDFAGAIAAGRGAVALDPDRGDARLALGRALLRAGEYDEAAIALICAERLSDRPDIAEFLALALRFARFDAATAAALRAIGPHRLTAGGAWNALGLLLRERGDQVGAIGCYVRAIELDPDDVEPLVNYANILADRNELEEALAVLDVALARHPDRAEIVFNRGVTLDCLHRLDDALAAYDRALALDPHHRLAAWNRGLLLLMQGRAEGWDQYERRWDVPNFPDTRQDFDRPLWSGEDLAGRTLLLHAEQGLGDTLQFIRYAPLIAARGGRVVVQCQKPLLRLLAGSAGIDGIVAKGDPLPAFDLHLPMMSAPQRFATSHRNVPPPAALAPIDALALPAGRDLKVGLVWSGNPAHRNDANRSMPFVALEPLFAVVGVRYVSLQVGAGVPLRHDLIDLGAGFRDFADTAAAMMALDLVISVDTSAVHLAGTLGRPTLLLLARRSDWRWLSGREDTPWYPGMRLIRQARAGDWRDVVAEARRIVEALAAAM